MHRLRRYLLAHMWEVLSAGAGLSQALILHWGVGIATPGSSFPAPLWLGIAALLVAANIGMIPLVARARARGGAWRRVGRDYMAIAGSTILLGTSVLASWFVFRFLPWLVTGEDGPELFRVASAIVVATVALVLAWGFSIGQLRIACTRHTIAIPGLQPENEGLRIVQISDLHMGNGLEGRRLGRLVDRINALDPDLLVITGDLFDFHPDEIPDAARRLAGLEARLGSYAVLGNHDYHAGLDAVADALARHAPNIRLLRGEIRPLDTPRPLYLAGVDDAGWEWAGRDLESQALERIGRELPGDGPVLLLIHRPEVFGQAARLGFPLVLAGHTHGGQVALPLPGRALSVARVISAFDRGLYRRESSILYVNRGIGVAGPAIRLNCSREIAILELRSGDGGDRIRSDEDGTMKTE